MIEIDGRRWRSLEDVYDGLLAALGAPDWHGRNMDALIDSMGTGDINAIDPPYLLRISGAAGWPSELREFFRELRGCIGTRLAARSEGDAREIEIVLDGDF